MVTFGTGTSGTGAATLTTPPRSPGMGGGTGTFPSTSGGARRAILENPYSPDSSCNIDSIDTSSVTVTVVLPPGVFSAADIPVTLEKPLRRLMVSAIGPTQTQNTYGYWISLSPQGHNDNSVNLVPSGKENWYPIKSSDIATTVFTEGTVIEFTKPISKFFLTVSGNPGTSFVITFTSADDVAIYWKPQNATQG